MWPGYSAGIRQCADGIFLSVDVCAKFIQKGSILSKIQQMQSRGFT
jgi:hypothetical protein